VYEYKSIKTLEVEMRLIFCNVLCMKISLSESWSYFLCMNISQSESWKWKREIFSVNENESIRILVLFSGAIFSV
jgi:hypothetical protein